MTLTKLVSRLEAIDGAGFLLRLGSVAGDGDFSGDADLVGETGLSMTSIRTVGFVTPSRRPKS